MNRVLRTCVGVVALWSSVCFGDEFRSNWHVSHDRIWLGEDVWANPVEDWRIADGRIECTRSGLNRNVHSLVAQLGKKNAGFQTSVIVGRADDGTSKGSVGFEIGIRSELADYRSSLIFGRGIKAGMNSDGLLFIDETKSKNKQPIQIGDGVRLHLTGTPKGDQYQLDLYAHYPKAKQLLAKVTKTVPSQKVIGNLALVNNFQLQTQIRRGKKGTVSQGSAAKFWFAHWTIKGEKVVSSPENSFGPILYAMHTLSRGTMKMTAQMPPLGAEDSQHVALEVKQHGDWKRIAAAKIDPLARTARFKVKDWNDAEDTPYRLAYTNTDKAGVAKVTHYSGTIRKDPVEKETVVVAGFTGNQHTSFPNALIAKNVGIQDPDVLVFTGDQIYENHGGYGIHRSPTEVAVVNYLRKIYLWGWSFRDLMRDRPTLLMPDDHDVYQGNIWGQGGRDSNGIRNHAKGGYAMHRDFVNAVQRTQTSHHPDAYDSTPVEQGIGVYYGDMLYGRISFAIIEDRKFKSGPEGKVNDWPGRPDHVRNRELDTSKLDKPGLVLLGDRQLKFLEDWSADWEGADMKMVCSQTIFCNLANYHGGNKMYLVADLDSNGWPQTGRNKALAAMRKGFAFHYAGDQHLASIVHHGIDDWNDAGYSFCVPSIAAGYPRAWRADAEGLPVQNRPSANLPNTGEYTEGLGNKVTVHAIANPESVNRKPLLELLHDKASGHGIVRMNKTTQRITMECWKLLFDASNPKATDQFPGWPKTIHQQDNYGRKAVGYLPKLEFKGATSAVVQVVNDATKETVYTLRVKENSFQPKVFAMGKYTIRIGGNEPNATVINAIAASTKAEAGLLPVDVN